MDNKTFTIESSSEFLRGEMVTKDLFKVFSTVYQNISASAYCLQDAIENCERKIRLYRKKIELDKIREQNRYERSKYVRK